MLLLLFMAPMNGANRAQQSTIDKLILYYKNTTVNDVKNDLMTRTKGHEQPLLAKVETVAGGGPTVEFFVAFDGHLLETQTSDATKAFMLLFCCFYVFSLNYPAPLYPVYRTIEDAMGMKNLGIGSTGAMKIFLDKLFPSRRARRSKEKGAPSTSSACTSMRQYMSPIPSATTENARCDDNEDEEDHQLSTANSPGVATLMAHEKQLRGQSSSQQPRLTSVCPTAAAVDHFFREESATTHQCPKLPTKQSQQPRR